MLLKKYGQVLRKYVVSLCPVMAPGKKRGVASLNGLVSVISVETGKALDYRVLTKKCAQCSFWENHKDSDGYV